MMELKHTLDAKNVARVVLAVQGTLSLARFAQKEDTAQRLARQLAICVRQESTWTLEAPAHATYAVHTPPPTRPGKYRALNAHFGTSVQEGVNGQRWLCSFR